MGCVAVCTGATAADADSVASLLQRSDQNIAENAGATCDEDLHACLGSVHVVRLERGSGAAGGGLSDGLGSTLKQRLRKSGFIGALGGVESIESSGLTNETNSAEMSAATDFGSAPRFALATLCASTARRHSGRRFEVPSIPSDAGTS